MTERTLPILAAVCIVAVPACSGTDSEQKSAREVPRRQRDTAAVSLIGEGVISTEAPEFGASYTPSGDTLFFGRSSRGDGTATILFSVRDTAGWSEPRTAPFSGEFRDVDPFVTPDGDRLYFSSDRPAPVGAAGLNSWWVDRSNGGWSGPRSAGPPLNSRSDEVFVSATRKGAVYFGSRRRGAQRVFRTRQTEEGWTAPEPQQFGELRGTGQPLVAPDGSFILLTNLGPGGTPDLFISCRSSSGWERPVPLPPGINSGRADYSPALDPRDGTLVFTSERRDVGTPAPDAEADSVRRPGDLYRSSYRPAERCD